MMAVDLSWKEPVASVIWVHSSVVRLADQQISRFLVQIRVCPLGRYVKAAERLWAKAVPTAAVQCKLRRWELNPGLPRDREKY